METRHPVEGRFDSEFSSIYNRCGVMVAWCRKSLKTFCENIAFSGKSTPYGEIFKILFQRDSPPHRSTCFVQISWNLATEKLVQSCVAYLTKNKLSPGCSALATARIATKICQGQPPTMYSEYSRFYLNRFTFGGVIPELVNTVKTHPKVFSILGWRLASSRIASSSISQTVRDRGIVRWRWRWL